MEVPVSAARGQGEDDDALREASSRALREQRALAMRWLGTVRLAGGAGFLCLAAYLGLVRELPDWRVYVGPLGVYVAAAAALRLARPRLTWLGEAEGYSVPLLDVPVAYVLQLRGMPLSAFPAGVAGWSLGLFVFLVVLSALSLRKGVVTTTIATSWAGEALLQRAAGVTWGAVVASGVVLVLAAAVTTWGSRRLELLLGRLVAAEVRRRIVMERNEELNRANETIARVNAELLSAQQEAETLTSLLVHDMKGPLTAVLGTLEHARMRTASQQGGAGIASELAVAWEAARRLLAMIEDLLRISRLEERALEPNLAATDAALLVAEVARAFQAQAEGRSAALLTAVEEGLLVSMDRDLIHRLLDNLVSNALSFVGSGARVEVAAWRDGEGWALAVRNEGPQVPPEVRGRLFEKFSSSRRQMRTYHVGLGLYLCRLVVEAHGGTIGLEDEAGWPVSFVARFPRS